MVQMTSVVGNIPQNVLNCISYLKKAKKQMVDIVIFPEVVTTGYILNSREEAFSLAETIPGKTTETFKKYCNSLNIYCIFGMIEKEEYNNHNNKNHSSLENTRLYNTIVFLGPNGFFYKYRKVHLGYIGLDRFLDNGNNHFEIIRTPFGKIGILVCYDCLHPEATRILALQGVQLVVLPTTWVLGREKNSEIIIPARALENRIFFLALNKVGKERDFIFCGKSRLVNPEGDTLLLQTGKEDFSIVEIELSEADQKKIVLEKGKWEANYFQDRRPEMYRSLSLL